MLSWAYRGPGRLTWTGRLSNSGGMPLTCLLPLTHSAPDTARHHACIRTCRRRIQCTSSRGTRTPARRRVREARRRRMRACGALGGLAVRPAGP